MSKSFFLADAADSAADEDDDDIDGDIDDDDIDDDDEEEDDDGNDADNADEDGNDNPAWLRLLGDELLLRLASTKFGNAARTM